ncbi:hypothetical protein DFH11DRAFT_1264264 [Phellopilus nigrolimitatus]|nr:hypothetical protein DFH11DRAFT_1264264 [Phellopilus nigrolimitatus]
MLTEGLSSKSFPYCSERLATLLQHCTKDRLNTEDWDEAAMLMTLCDRSRDYSPPMECEGLSSGKRGTGDAEIKRCSMALDQHQNFQRTFDVYRILVVPEKCKSLNGMFNVDPSKAVYENITLELVAFFHTLSTKETKNDQYFVRWEDLLQAFQESVADLSSAKHSLTEFNKQFAVDLNGMAQGTITMLEVMKLKGLEMNNEISSELEDKLDKLSENHQNALTRTVSSVENSLSLGMKAILDASQESRKDLDLAVNFAISQLMGAVNDLSMARQEFKHLSIFVKETTSKAYNQAFLLDKKQHEVAESMVGLTTDINALSSTARELNVSMSNIKLDNLGRFSWPKLYGSPGLFNYIFRWLDLAPYGLFGFIIFSLPRFVSERILGAFIWLSATLFSCLASLLLSHRRRSSFDESDAERLFPRMAFASPSVDNSHIFPYGDKHHAIAATSPVSCQITRIVEVITVYRDDKSVQRTLSGPATAQKTTNIYWNPVRSRTISRLPTRLFMSEPPPDRRPSSNF